MTYLEIRQRIAEMLGLSSTDVTPDDNANIQTKLKEWVNTRYRVLCGKRSWNWMIQDDILQTEEEITTGTVHVIADSSTITFTSGPTDSVAEWFIQFEGTDDWYEIESHTAASTSATLTTPYIGTTDTAATYKLRKVYYALPEDTGKVLDMRQARTDRKIRYFPVRHLDRFVADRTQSGTPEVYTIVGLDANNQFRTEFYPVPSARINIAIRYYQIVTEMSTDADEPVIPESFHDILVWDVLCTYGYMFLDDTRMVQAKSVRDAIYKDMVDNDVDGENITERSPFDVDLTARESFLRQLQLPIVP